MAAIRTPSSRSNQRSQSGYSVPPPRRTRRSAPHRPTLKCANALPGSGGALHRFPTAFRIDSLSGSRPRGQGRVTRREWWCRRRHLVDLACPLLPFYHIQLSGYGNALIFKRNVFCAQWNTVRLIRQKFALKAGVLSCQCSPPRRRTVQHMAGIAYDRKLEMAQVSSKVATCEYFSLASAASARPL